MMDTAGNTPSTDGQVEIDTPGGARIKLPPLVVKVAMVALCSALFGAGGARLWDHFGTGGITTGKTYVEETAPPMVQRVRTNEALLAVHDSEIKALQESDRAIIMAIKDGFDRNDVWHQKLFDQINSLRK
jgi:hypothetical protein